MNKQFMSNYRNTSAEGPNHFKIELVLVNIY